MFDMSFLLYRSETEVAPGSATARQILNEAQTRNADHAVTGYLHHEENFFFQWLEGPTPALDGITAKIQRDPRHHHLTFLWRGTTDDRQFDGWDMGYSTIADGSLLSWLAENPVAQRERRAYASSVLAFLQCRTEATRAD